MFPLLPVLILLLLQGPSNLERLALDGRLPAGLERIQREVHLPDGRERAQALAQLIAAAGDLELSAAILALVEPDAPKSEPVVHQEPCPLPEVPDRAPPDGFRQSGRTRDGPQ